MATKRVSAKVRRILRANPSVKGFSETLKPKVVGGKPRASLAIRVYVEKKLPKSKIPKGLVLPLKIGGIRVDVVEIGKIEPSQANRGRFRPLEGGASGIHTGGGAGTLGYFMREKKQPAPPKKPQWYALSCAHVLHPVSGQNETIQPSPLDGGNAPADWVGKESLYTYDGVDAALSRIDVGARATIVGLPSPSGNAVAVEGMTVAKSGRTTGVTYGKVVDDGAEFNFGHWGSAPGAVRFHGVIVVHNKHQDFSQGGDSGSLVIDPADQTIVGLLFGGSPPGVPVAQTRTLIAPINRVLKAFPQEMLVLPGETWP